jgi:hypothetical protein
MRASSIRSVLASALLLTTLFSGWFVPARAQVSSSAVSMALVSESAWNSFSRPLQLKVRVTNGSETSLQDLALVLTIEVRARARSLYQLSLHQDATAVLHSVPFPQTGAIAPGESRVFTIRQPLKDLALVSDNGIYPLQVQLLSHENVMATVRTPMIFLIEHPKTPLHLTWTWVLDEPQQLGPDGVFQPGPIEADIAPGGRLSAMVGAIDAATPAPVDMVVSPVLLQELDVMSKGYRIAGTFGSIRTVREGSAGAADASRMLELLRGIAGRPATELVALPFADARIPSLDQSGLATDVPGLLARGRQTVASILGAQPSTRVFHPVQSQIDATTAAQLSAQGQSILLLNEGSVPVRTDVTPNPAPVVRLTAGAHPPQAVIPDVQTTTLAQAYTSDPTLQARVALGELAAVWLELPGTPGRGASLLFGESSTYSPAFYRAFSSLVRASPWLRPVTAATMTSLIGNQARASLRSATYPGLSSELVSRVLEVRRHLELFASTVQGADGLVARLRSTVLQAEGGTSLIRPDLGMRYADWVQGQIGATFRKVVPPITQRIFTLPSQRGSIPLALRNDNAFSMRVAVRFVTDRRVAFPTGNVRSLTLPPKAVTRFLVDVRAQTTGRFPMKLQVFPQGSYCGSCLIAESDLIVRSTAYNRVALALTIGAALFLLGRWGRRFLPRRKTT